MGVEGSSSGVAMGPKRPSKSKESAVVSSLSADAEIKLASSADPSAGAAEGSEAVSRPDDVEVIGILLSENPNDEMTGCIVWAGAVTDAWDADASNLEELKFVIGDDSGDGSEGNANFVANDLTAERVIAETGAGMSREIGLACDPWEYPRFWTAANEVFGCAVPTMAWLVDRPEMLVGNRAFATLAIAELEAALGFFFVVFFDFGEVFELVPLATPAGEVLP